MAYVKNPHGPCEQGYVKNPHRPCEQGCGNEAQVYGGGSKAGDWAGFYCLPCLDALGFHAWDFLVEDPEAEQTADWLFIYTIFCD
jgi:hypothetical protein